MSGKENSEANCNVPVTVTERDLRVLHRRFLKETKSFIAAKNQTISPNALTEIRRIFGDIEKTHKAYCECANQFKDTIEVEDVEKREEIVEKTDLLTQQLDVIKTDLDEIEATFQEQELKLARDLQKGTCKSTHSKGSSVRSTHSTHRSGNLFNLDRLSNHERVLVAESRLKAAALDVELAKQLAFARGDKVLPQPGTLESKKNDLNTNPIEIAPSSSGLHGGSASIDNIEKVSKLYSSNSNTEGCQASISTFGVGYSGSAGDNYLAGKVLIESGSKVQFDGNPKNFITFKQGMDRVLSLHGSRFGLIYDILQSRCIGKAAEAIKFCDRISDPELAVKSALDRLQTFFGDKNVVVEAHIANVTRNELVKWNTDSYQSFLNELEDIKVLLHDQSQKSMMNSPGVIKGIIARLPKRTRDELAKLLCDSNEHLPDFDQLLKFVERQLKLVSHPVMNIVPKNSEPRAKDDFSYRASSYKTPARRELNAVRLHNQNVTSSRPFKCPVVGCGRNESHSLWNCGKYAELSLRDRWAIAANQNYCYKCLNQGHIQENCKSRYSCRNCKSSHHHYLLCQNVEQSKSNEVVVNNETVNSHNVIFQDEKKLLPVIPVTVINVDTGKSVSINCLLDSGCDTTIATKRLAKMLALNPKSITNVKLSTSIAESYDTAFKADIIIESNYTHARFYLYDVLCVDKVAVHANPSCSRILQTVGLDKVKGLKMPCAEQSAIDLVIGIDYEHLHDVSEVRRSDSHNVAAKLSKLGWFVIGHVRFRKDLTTLLVHRCMLTFVT